jgi:glycine betaine catabolism A
MSLDRNVTLQSPVTPDEVTATRQPTERASTLPPRVFHDPDVLNYEIEAWFRRDWLNIGREEDAPEPGSYFLVNVFDEQIIVVRSNDCELRAFYNVCRHRGATILSESAGQRQYFQCPYHGWVYDLEGRLQRPPHTRSLQDFHCEHYGLYHVRLGTWQGFVFINLSPEAPPLEAYLETEWLFHQPNEFNRYSLREFRRAKHMEYEVRANWKVIMENYAECYHCPDVHPLLNRMTPFKPVQSSSGWGMELVDGYETLSMDGYLNGRPILPGAREEDLKRVYYLGIWPNFLYAIHPDYLLTHHAWPIDAENTKVICELFAHADAIAQPGFDLSSPAEFWDRTNLEDWHVCELQQEGTRSRVHTPGRYIAREGGTHAFDVMVADRYANDGKKTVLADGEHEGETIHSCDIVAQTE